MKRNYLYFFCIILQICISCDKNSDISLTKKNKPELTQYVNPFIGTDGPGNTYPGATVPFGMVQLSPDIGIPGWDRIAGYFYQDSIISGFSHTHLTGTGAGDLYDILVMPTNSKFNKRIEANGFIPFSYFDHSQEEATAGYYQVNLKSYDINVELTAMRRVGIQRYTFPKDKNTQIHVNLGFTMNWDAPTDTYIKVVDSTTIEGYRKSTGWAKDQRIYFVIQFSKAFSGYELYENDSLTKNPVKARKTRIVLNYDTQEREQIVIKTALSTANIEGAYASMRTETSDFDFDKYREAAQKKWNEQLNKIEIMTDNHDKKVIFYTMLYQSMLAPTLLSDPNGNYKSANDTIGHAEGYEQYDTFSLWDTFRAAHPLYTIIHPKRTQDFIASMLAHYKETGTLPVWSMQGNETNMMIGYHAVPVIVDAYFKGISMDVELAYEACRASAMVDERQIDIYKKLGYVPADDKNENWSVSKTLEYAYDDWCIAEFAKSLGKEVDAEYFYQRAENWKHLFDEKTTFIRPKDQDGNFIEPFVAKEYTPYYCESNAWHYFWFVPHDIDGLIEKTGGKERFEQKLDSMFTYYPSPEDKLPIFSTGMIGQYAHGNEPSHHVAYLYNYIGKPEKAQQRIYEILETQYKNEPNGHCGNEDCGQMSSWYVLSSLGFYPVNPAEGKYVLGAPSFDKTVIHLDSGKDFVIEVKKISKNDGNSNRALLNDKPLKRNYITHRELISGGRLTFER